MYWMTLTWLWAKVTAVVLININPVIRPVATKLGSYIPVVMNLNWLNCGAIL